MSVLQTAARFAWTILLRAAYLLTSANAKPVAVLGFDCLEKNMTIFPAHMGNIDNRQRVGRLDN